MPKDSQNISDELKSTMVCCGLLTLKMPQFCSDWSIRSQKISNLFGLASKIAGSLPDDDQMANCKYIIANLILCIHPNCITHCVSGFLACHYNSFYHSQKFWKCSLQLIEDLELHVVEGECLAILAECDHGQGAKELVRWKQSIGAHVQCSVPLMYGLEIVMIRVLICLIVSLFIS